MTTWTVGNKPGALSTGYKVSTQGNYCFGANVSGRPILGLSITSATSIGGVGQNLILEVQDGAGRIFYIPARSSAF